jgi:predicted transcriptional regulator
MREPDRRRTDRGSCYDIKQLWQRNHEIIGLAVQGFEQKEIANILGVHPVTVSNTLNSELGMKKLSELRKCRDEDIVKVSEEVARLAKKALDVYEDIFDNDTVSYKLKKDAADTVLMDLGGHRAPTKIDTRSLHMTATAEEIEEFKKRGVAAARETGMLVELPEEAEHSDTKGTTE